MRNVALSYVEAGQEDYGGVSYRFSVMPRMTTYIVCSMAKDEYSGSSYPPRLIFRAVMIHTVVDDSLLGSWPKV